jgi:hypothetical protein
MYRQPRVVQSMAPKLRVLACFRASLFGDFNWTVSLMTWVLLSSGCTAAREDAVASIMIPRAFGDIVRAEGPYFMMKSSVRCRTRNESMFWRRPEKNAKNQYLLMR